MKRKIKQFAKENPKITLLLSKSHNQILGRNKIRMTSANIKEIGITYFKKTKFDVKGENNVIIIKDLARLINCTIFIRGNNNRIIIDENVMLNNVRLSVGDNNNTVAIGKNTTIYGYTHFSVGEGTSLSIGSGCLFSSGIIFRTGDSHSIVDLNGERINPAKDIVIGDRVWIGTKVMCLKGTHISNNSINGAGSLVTKRFDEENVVVAGHPAKVVKSGVDWLGKKI